LSKIKLQELVLHNWPAKVLSVGCALVLFVFYQTSTLEERFFSVPLLVEGADNMVPANRYPRMIRVTLRGNANSIYPVINSDIETFINIGGANEKGTRHFPVQVRKKGTALDVETLEISVDPMEITIELDTKFSTFVNVTPKTQGEVAAGFELTRKTLNPSRIRIEGPEGLVRHYTELSTEAVDLEGRNTDFTVITRVANPDPLIALQGESIIEFHGEVRPVLIIRSFTAVPVGIRNLDERLRFADPPEFGELRLEGPQNELEAWSPEGNVSVDCAGITQPGEYDLSLQLSLPINCRVLGTVAEASALAALNRTEAETGRAAADETSPAIHATIVAVQAVQTER
jgi:YbbR domain-containing protein